MSTYSLIIPSSIGVDKPIEFIKNKLWVIPVCEENNAKRSVFEPKDIKFIFNNINSYKEIENLIKEWFTFFGFLLPIPSDFSYLTLNKHIHKECFESPSELKIGDHLQNVRLPEKGERHFYSIIDNILPIPFNSQINTNSLNIIELYKKYESLNTDGSLRNNIEFLSVSKNLMAHASYFYDNVFYKTAHYYFLFESIINRNVSSGKKKTKKCSNCNNEIQFNLSLLDKVEIFFSEKGYNKNNIEFILRLIKAYRRDRSKVVHWGKKQTRESAIDNLSNKVEKEIITLEDEIEHDGVSVSSDIYFSELCQYLIIEELSSN